MQAGNFYSKTTLVGTSRDCKREIQYCPVSWIQELTPKNAAEMKERVTHAQAYDGQLTWEIHVFQALRALTTVWKHAH